MIKKCVTQMPFRDSMKPTSLKQRAFQNVIQRKKKESEQQDTVGLTSALDSFLKNYIYYLEIKNL